MGGEYVESALKNFQDGIAYLLDKNKVPEEHREPWLYPYLLATAYLYQGLAFRNALRLNEAAHSYSQAAYCYRSINYLPGLAEAMNNLAYIYARQGRLETAQASCGEALSIRQELGDEYNIGLSLNTKGIIYERMDRPITAAHNSEQALALFKEIGNERGIILAEINLGRSYRRKARSPEWGQKDEDFEAGIRHLEDAVYRQEQLGASADMFYRIEAYNELGCLYRDWVATLAEKDIRDDDRALEYLERAESHLNESASLATQEGQVLTRHAVQYVDSMEDLARLYYWRGKLELSVGPWAKQRGIDRPLQAMKSLLDEAKRLAEEHLKEWEELRLIVGKIHHQYARLAREEAEKEEEKKKEEEKLDYAAKHYARAAASLEGYSFDAPELRKTVSDACEWLCTLQPKEAKKRIEQMYATLKADGQKSERLKEWVNSVVFPRLGVGWPEDNQGVAHG
jgi:tetratricopeptide (TPR) repeat protein